MAEVFTPMFYALALVAASYWFHHRYACLKASVLAGLTSAALSLACFFVLKGVFNPFAFVAAFLVYGLGLAFASAMMSGCIGAVCQLRKD